MGNKIGAVPPLRPSGILKYKAPVLALGLPSAEQAYRVIVPEKRSDETTHHVLGTGGQGLLLGGALGANASWKKSLKDIKKQVYNGHRSIKLIAENYFPRDSKAYEKMGKDVGFYIDEYLTAKPRIIPKFNVDLFEQKKFGNAAKIIRDDFLPGVRQKIEDHVGNIAKIETAGDSVAENFKSSKTAALSLEQKNLEAWERVARKHVRMQRVFHGMSALAAASCALGAHQLWSAAKEDGARRGASWALGRNTVRAFGEILGSTGGGAIGAAFGSVPGGLTGGYLGSVYGGRIADEIYNSVAAQDLRPGSATASWFKDLPASQNRL